MEVPPSIEDMRRRSWIHGEDEEFSLGFFKFEIPLRYAGEAIQ